MKERNSVASYDAYNTTNFGIQPSDRVHDYLRSIVQDSRYNGFEKKLLGQIKTFNLDPEKNEITYKLTIGQSLCNKDGMLHGGAASTMLDNLSSTALYTINKAGFWDNLGVSRALSVIYHKAVPCGVTVVIRCTVIAVGKRLATVRATIEDQQGVVLVSCVHDKFAHLASRM